MTVARPRLLVCDDEPAARHAAARALGTGYDIEECGDGRACLAALERQPADLVLLDLRMPVLDGRETLLLIAARHGAPPVVVVTADGSLRTAVEAVKAGAADFLTKPYEIDELRHVVARTLRAATLTHENERLRGEVRRLAGGSLVGESPAMRAVLLALRRVAPTSASLLLTGETGTGKELAARLVHELSSVSSGPFVAVNAAAIPDTLVESELFGHRKGAFTGADRDRAGKVREADGGTLFLDEIGDMPLSVQAKLLRVLGEGLVEPLGGGRPQSVSVRVVSATHRDLPRLVSDGRFREDLMFRLRVVDVTMPPLRERGNDVLLLARDALARSPRGPLGLAPETEKALLAYRWPGNVRELRNAMERAAIFATGPLVTPEDLPRDVRGGVADPLPRKVPEPFVWDPTVDFATAKERVVERFERSVLEGALRFHDGNVSQTARALGLLRQNLQQKLKDLGIRTSRPEPPS